MKRIGPYSRPATLAKLDGRTKAARTLRDLRKEMIAHVGGAPSVTQRLLIDRAAMLQLRLSLMDAATLNEPAMSERDAREYMHLSNALTRALRQIGFKSAGGRSLASYIGERAVAA